MCLMQFLYAEAWDGKKFLECKDCPIKADCPEYEPKDEPQTECPQANICRKPCKECGACEEVCGMWEKLKAEPQTGRGE